MIGPLAKFIDRSALQIAYAMLPQSMWREAANERDLKLEQAVQFLNGPDFIPAESQPAQLDFGPDTSGGRFRFPTPQPCEFAENNVVHGRLYRCGERWQERPVVILYAPDGARWFRCQVTVLLLCSPIAGKMKPVVRTLCGLVD